MVIIISVRHSFYNDDNVRKLGNNMEESSDMNTIELNKVKMQSKVKEL